jgi:hypothetical protein
VNTANKPVRKASSIVPVATVALIERKKSRAPSRFTPSRNSPRTEHLKKLQSRTVFEKRDAPFRHVQATEPVDPLENDRL